jgi:hypothetical protein
LKKQKKAKNPPFPPKTPHPIKISHFPEKETRDFSRKD